ncbi:ParB N-terminal domain-containing protein [Ornithinimicrobium panacihumi]|uniref:ParB N-terminal domain-containing protein n=1 Tax=Ornithinimicrobium panacihumi TaxID=2008449 RepID=UPI003F89792C
MSEQPVGSVQVERTVASIRVGNRHRAELGDIDVLAASIKRDGLLQPITVTPDGFLVCGARRLAALKMLGTKTVNVWVRSGLSDRLGQLLAEQDDNVLHKPLTALEAAALYRELKAIMSEEAALREQSTQFQKGHAPGEHGGEHLPPPPGQAGKTREQAAAMIPGGASYRTYDKIGYVEQVATDRKFPEHVRVAAQAALDQIQAGGPVDPEYTRIRTLATSTTEQARAARDAELHQIANEAVARVQVEARTKKKEQSRKTRPVSPADEGITLLGVRAFVLTWTDLDQWWIKYDLAGLATDLSDEQADAFYAVVEGTVTFAEDLRTARAARPPVVEDITPAPLR